MVDQPPAGYAHIEAFFTAKDDAVYAILPRWPENDAVLSNIAAGSGSKISLLETGDELKSQMRGRQLVIEVPAALRTKLPHRQAYVLKMTGVADQA
jgi:alpha-L-fucosidase